MDRKLRRDVNPLRTVQMDEYVRLAVGQPDDELLKIYFDARAGGTESAGPQLTENERRWVVANLQNNSSWQSSWKQLEEQVGHPVAWQTETGARPALASTRALDRLPRRAEVVRRPLAAVLVALVLYGVLWVGGRAALPDTYHWASLHGFETLLDRQTRSNGTEAQSAFSKGADALLATRRTTFGLFPHYDIAEVEIAIRHFQAAYSESQDPFQRAEIAFFMSKAYLMLENVEQARYWLQQVEAQRVADYREEAERLLQEMSSTR